MTITTKHNIGEKLVINGKERKIISAHIYESEQKHTERYYLGNGVWVTINKKRRENL